MRSARIRDRLTRFTLDYRRRPLELLSYDVPGQDRATAVAISHFIFGRTDRIMADGHSREYRYPGFIEKEGVVWVGQSVFLVTPERSREMRGFLDLKGVAYGRIGVRFD